MRTTVETFLPVVLAGTTFVAVGSSAQHIRPLAELVEHFESTTVFWRQFDVAKQIVNTGDASVLRRLEPWLFLEDRHLRGNAAFIFASLGDPRGLETILTILTDRAPRSEGQGIPGGGFSVAGQIRADRYYAVQLLGELKDPRTIASLVPLLEDNEIDYKVAWALGEIGDARATPPLMAALGNRQALVRVTAIQALVKLRATEALPKLRELLDDHAMPSAGDQVTVADTARAAIASLQKEP